MKISEETIFGMIVSGLICQLYIFLLEVKRKIEVIVGFVWNT